MKTLIVLTGPTGVGKTELSLSIAESLGSFIISCDSRQIFREITIGTASPSKVQLDRIKHCFIGSRSIHDYYSAARFETDVMELIESRSYKKFDNILMTGGSMLYIDAVCNGIDDMPDVNEELRKDLYLQYMEEGLESILEQLKILDPEYYEKVDQKNPKRVIHGLEICMMAGRPYSSFRKEKAKERPFNIIKICLNRDRKELYSRIDIRVQEMIKDGLIEEARRLYPFRSLNALNTVGYKELFDYFDGNSTLEEAIVNIQNNTHKYARKQLTWFRRDPSYHWFHPDDTLGITKLLNEKGIILNSKI